MPVDFYYKGLSAEDRIYPHKPNKSAALAQGTLYEAWFDTLKISPWYKEICSSKKFPSISSKKTWEQFGDLSNLTFGNWWRKTGYKIFSETIPYRPVREVKLGYAIKHADDENKAPTLILEIPLNLSPSQLTHQFQLLVEKQFEYRNAIGNLKYLDQDFSQENSINDDVLFSTRNDYNRWDHSTALVHQTRDTKITYQQIQIWLKSFVKWTAAKEANPKLTQSDFAQLLMLKPKGVRSLGKGVLLSKKDKAIYASALNEHLKMARFLMAHATEGLFPFTEPHPWVKGPSRKPRKAI